MTSQTSHNSHTLTFSQLVGTFVVDKELLGAQDPYVIFEAGGHKCQTKAIKGVGASTCEWKETYTLKEFGAKSAVKEATSKATGSHKNGTVLEVTAYNHNTLRPDGTIGSGTIDLATLGGSQLSGSGDRVTVHLTDKKGKNVGELKFLIHGGGYQGSSSGSGHGTGAGVGAGAGAAGAGLAAGSGNHGSTSGRQGPTTGVGAGTTEHMAHDAARKAATQERDVTVEGREGKAYGHPTGAATTGTGTGAGYDQSRTGVTGHEHTHGHHGHHHNHPASGNRAIDAQAGEVVDRQYYVAKEDRPQDQALVEQFREHNPYEKQYETSVQHTGRERLVDTSIEALGTQERVVDTRHHVHANPMEQIARAVPAGATAQRPGGEGWVQGKVGPVCDTTQFAVTGDITVDKERVTNLKEHREFEKEFEVKTQVVGERQLEEAGRIEALNRERILLDEKKKVACESHPHVEAPSSSTGLTSGTTGGYTAGQGNREVGAGQAYNQGSNLTGGTGTGHHQGNPLTGSTGTGHHQGSGLTGTGTGHDNPLTGNTGTGHHQGSGLTGTGTGHGNPLTGNTGTGHHQGSGLTGTGTGHGNPLSGNTGTGHHQGSGLTGTGTGTGHGNPLTGNTGTGHHQGSGLTGTGHNQGTGLTGNTGTGHNTAGQDQSVLSKLKNAVTGGNN